MWIYQVEPCPWRPPKCVAFDWEPTLRHHAEEGEQDIKATAVRNREGGVEKWNRGERRRSCPERAADLLAGGRALAGINRLIARESIRPKEQLSKALDGRYDFVIVDTSPSFSELGTNVLFYCSEAVVPVSMEVLAAEGLVSFAEEVRHVQQYHDLAGRWILATFVDGRTRKSAEILEALHAKYGDLVTLPVRYSSALSERLRVGKDDLRVQAQGPGSRGLCSDRGSRGMKLIYNSEGGLDSLPGGPKRGGTTWSEQNLFAYRNALPRLLSRRHVNHASGVCLVFVPEG